MLRSDDDSDIVERGRNAEEKVQLKKKEKMNIPVVPLFVLFSYFFFIHFFLLHSFHDNRHNGMCFQGSLFGKCIHYYKTGGRGRQPANSIILFWHQE